MGQQPTSLFPSTLKMYFIDPHGLGALRKWLDQFWDDALAAFQAEIEKAGTKQSEE